jgi:hypothetical protein
MGSEKVVAGVQAAMCRWGGIFRRKQRGYPAPEKLTKRLLVGKLVNHLNAGVCMDHNEVTIAICQNAMRLSARKGDLILLVSKKGPAGLIDRNSRGLVITTPNQRLALCAAVVTDICPPWMYHRSRSYPANSYRADQIYTVKILKGARDQLRERSSAIEAPIHEEGTRTWTVKYRNGVEAKYSLKETARFHRLPGEGCNAMPDSVRFTDFNGPVIRCRIFTVLPGQECHLKSKNFPQKFEKFLGLRLKVWSDPPPPKELWNFALSLWNDHRKRKATPQENPETA